MTIIAVGQMQEGSVLVADRLGYRITSFTIGSGEKRITVKRSQYFADSKIEFTKDGHIYGLAGIFQDNAKERLSDFSFQKFKNYHLMPECLLPSKEILRELPNIKSRVSAGNNEIGLYGIFATNIESATSFVTKGHFPTHLYDFLERPARPIGDNNYATSHYDLNPFQWISESPMRSLESLADDLTLSVLECADRSKIIGGVETYIIRPGKVTQHYIEEPDLSNNEMEIEIHT